MLLNSINNYPTLTNNTVTSYSNKAGIPMEQNKGMDKASENATFQIKTDSYMPGLEPKVIEYKNRGAEVSAYVKENMKPTKEVEEVENPQDTTLTYNPDGSFTVPPLDSTISITA